jgi:hypothetical protein
MKWIKHDGTEIEAIGVVELVPEQPTIFIVNWYPEGVVKRERNCLGSSAFANSALPIGAKHGSVIDCQLSVRRP